MINSDRIHPGRRVYGAHGPLLANPNGGKRRVREKVHGTVLKAVDQHKWEVVFDFDGKTKIVTSKSLKIVADEAGIPIDELTSNTSPSPPVLPQQIDSEAQSSDCTPPLPIKEDTAANDAIEEEEDVRDVDVVVEEEGTPNNDFCFTEADFLEYQSGMNSATLHRNKHKIAWEEIKALTGEEVVVESSQDGKIVWRVVPSVLEDKMSKIVEKEIAHYNNKNNSVFKNNNFKDVAEAFWSTWPVDIDEDITRLNEAIKAENTLRKERFQHVLREVTKKEFKIFHALLIGATLHSKKGTALWPKKNAKRRSLAASVDYGEWMKEWRFKEIKQYIPAIMEDATMKEEDDWYRFKRRVQLFNKKNKELYFASSVLIFDESMSAFIPR